MDTGNGKINILMLPLLARGHTSPYLELAKKLTERNFSIYFCSTPIILSTLKHSITDNYSSSIKLVEINLPSLPALPPHHHTTNGLPSHLIPTLHQAFEMASPAFSDILTTLSPDLVIYDFNPPWAPTIAASHNIPAVQFLTSGAAVLSFGLHRIKKGGIEFPFPAFQLWRSPEFLFRRRDVPPESYVKEGASGMGVLDAIKGSCNIILMNTFREIEGKYIDYASVLTEKKIVPVGPLVQDNIVGENEHKDEIIQWLDKKGESSTVFVSFGSEYFLSNEEMEEVAHGLELSEVNFIWVVRFPVGEKVKIEEALPRGFLDRVKERGLVVENWAPQAKILAHSSTGGFVSHCGWNSMMETLKFGVPIIAMPMHLDQPANARLVEEVGVGVDVQRDENGRLSREEMAQMIRKVVVLEKNGEDIRIKAKDFSRRIRMKGEEQMDEAVEELLKLCKERKVAQKVE